MTEEMVRYYALRAQEYDRVYTMERCPIASRLVRRDAYAPCADAPAFDAGFAGLWLSHVDRARMTEFLDAFHSYLLPGAPW